MARPAGWFLSAPGEAAPPGQPGTEPARTDNPRADHDGRAGLAGPGSFEDAGFFAGPTGQDGPDAFEGPDAYEAFAYGDPRAYEEPGSYDEPGLYGESGAYGEPEGNGRSSAYGEPEGYGEPAAYGESGAYEEPAAYGETAAFLEPAAYGEPGGHGPGAYGERDADGESAGQWRESVVGETEALHGRAGGPGFRVPAGLVRGTRDPEGRSGWQVSHGLWEDSEIGWDGPPGTPPSHGRPDGGPAAAAPLSAPTLADAAPGTLPRRQARPTAPTAPGLTRREPPPRGPAWTPRPHEPRPPEPQPFQRRPGEPARPDARRPWEEPRGQGPAGAARTRRRGRAWHMARVAVPVALIFLVGAGALVMLTGKTHEILSNAGSQSRASSSAPAAAPAGHPGDAAFPGYPGEQGSESVNSIASANGVQLAAGSADGRPAIWRRGTGGSWTLLTSASILQQPARTILSSIVHGPAGWLAVGDVAPVPFGGAGTAQAPVILTSADGVSWHSLIGQAGAFSGPGFQVNSAASSGSGYVVVGSQYVHGQPLDAMWWSADLVNWARGGDTMASTMSTAASGMSNSEIFAVAAAPGGFVAVGTHNDCHTAWVTADGRHWRSYDIPKPNGSQEPLLSQVAVTGNVVVATGDLGVKGGRIPLVVVSDDGGVHWKGTAIGNYGAFAGPQGTVTALTSDGAGFVAAGLVGPKGAHHAVTWTSHDGAAWSQPMPAGSGTQAITALTSAGGSVAQVATVTAQYGTRSVELPTGH